jgi:hypothetical protein
VATNGPYAVFAIESFALASTATTAVEESFVALRSLVVALTVAVLLSGPSVAGRTTSAIVAETPLLSVPRLQVTVVVPLQFPCDGVAETNVVPAGQACP